MVDTGTHGLVPLGVMGEANRLTDDERERVVRAFRDALPRSQALVVGVSAGGTDAVIEAGRRAVDLGADALLVGPPLVQNDAVIFEYYERIDKSTTVPMVIHDYPQATHIILSAALLARLHRELRWARYLKIEDAPTGPKIANVRSLAGESCGIFGAYGGLYALEDLERGACGIMTGFVYQDLLVRIYTLHRAGDIQRAAELFYAVLPLIRFEFQPGIGVSLRKNILVKLGVLRAATVRHPGATADAATIEQLDRIIAFLEARGYLRRGSEASYR